MGSGQHTPVGLNAGFKHPGRISSSWSPSSSSRFAVGRDVEAARRTRPGEIWKSESAPLFLRLRAPAVAHNCRQEAPAQHIFVSDMRMHAYTTQLLKEISVRSYFCRSLCASVLFRSEIIVALSHCVCVCVCVVIILVWI